jgi:molybdopterin synthase sulfur carrier subunit
MLLKIKLFASLRKGRFDKATMEFPAGTTVNDIIDKLALPKDDITLVFLNGRHSQLTATPQEGDTLALFPAVGGG